MAFPTSGCIAYWKLDSDSTDSTASNIDGTDTSISYTTAGIIGNSATFGGASKINLGANLGFERTDSFSVSFWVKQTGTGLYEYIGKCDDPHATHTAHGRSIWGVDGKIGINMNAGTGAGNNELQVQTTTATVNSGNRTHVVFTYNGTSAATGVKIYINATEITSKTTNFNTLSASIANSVSATIGEYADNSRPFTGSMDEKGVRNAVLSSTDVTTLYNGGSGLTYPVVTTAIKSINGLAYASIKSINGLAIASMKSINGLA